MFVSTIPYQPSVMFAGKAMLFLEVEHPNVASLEWAHKHRLGWKGLPGNKLKGKSQYN